MKRFGIGLALAGLISGCANPLSALQEISPAAIEAGVKDRLKGSTLTTYRFERHTMQWALDQKLAEGTSYYQPSKEIWVVIAEGDILPSAFRGAHVGPHNPVSVHFSRLTMLIDPKDGSSFSETATPAPSDGIGR
jgi:hypothetical protein